MRISKENATNAALKITEPLKEKIADIDLKIRQVVTDIFLKKIPKEVMAAYNKYPHVVKTSSNYYVGDFCPHYNNGSGSTRIIYLETLPDFGRDATVHEKATITALCNDKETAIEKYDTANSQIVNTILALGTDKRVLTEFPEVYKYLVCVPTKTEVMVNLAPVRMLACSLIPGCETVAE